MTKEELEKEAEEKYHNHKIVDFQGFYTHHYYYLGYVESAEPREKRIADLEEKISVLLSCKNCPENKGGYICEKEYNDKCLAQKIEFIKELQKENAELKQENNNLVTVIEKSKSWGISPLNSLIIKNLDDQLIKAKEIISEYVRLANLEKEDTVAIWQLYHKAEAFLKE